MLSCGIGTVKLRISGTSFMEKIGRAGSPLGGTRWGRSGCNDVVLQPG